jgi:predicted nicotinamide N-methyase
LEPDATRSMGRRRLPSTEYIGPVIVTTLKFGESSVKVVRPAEPDRLLDDPVVHDWNQSDDYMPYWAYLWPGARLLAEVLAREPWPECGHGQVPPCALEIGCGVGLAGMVALRRGLRVHFTDYDLAPLRFVDRSMRENGFDPNLCTTGLLDWREPPQLTFPIILGSDVLYERRLVPLVANLLAAMLEPGGQALIACPGRSSAESFPDAVRSCGLSCHAEPVASAAGDHQFTSGVVYRIRRKA